MRLYNYINEDLPYDTPLFKLIDERAKPFVREMKSWAKSGDNRIDFFYRGVKEEPDKWEIRQSHLDDRTPRGMSRAEQYVMNQSFIKKFGWPGRNGVLATTDKTSAAMFGRPCIFIPFGNYKYVWSAKIGDINLSEYEWEELSDAIENALEDFEGLVDGPWDTRGWERLPEKNKENLYRMVEKKADKFINKYQDTDLIRANLYGHEVSFNCDEYLLINKLYKTPLEKKYMSFERKLSTTH